MIQAERAVIGTLLIEQDRIADVYPILRPKMFTELLFGRMYNEFCKAYEGNYQLDYILLMQRISDVDPQWLRGLIANLINDVDTVVVVKSAAEVIVEDWRRREIKAITGKKREAESSRDEINQIVGDLQGLLVAATEGVSLKKLTETIKDDYFKNRDSPPVKLGVSGVDNVVKNLETGDVTVIAARPAVGKSAFMVQVATNLSRGDIKVGFFSLEMSKRQLYERFVSHISGIALDRVRFGTDYLHDEQERYAKALTVLEKAENIILYADDKDTRCPRTASQIEAACRTDGIKIAIIDYLQLMSPEKTYQGNKAAEVGEISRKVKEAAMRLGIHIIALSQMNRGVEYRASRKPMLSDLRESGAIEQDASNIIFLWNKDENDKSKKGCLIAKQRQGDTGEIELEFDGAHMVFHAVGKEGFVPSVEAPFG